MPHPRDGHIEDRLTRAGVLVLVGVLTVSSLIGMVTDPARDLLTRAAGVALTALSSAGFVAVHVGLIRQRRLARLPWYAALAAAGSVALFVFFGSWTMLGLGLAAIGLGVQGAQGFVATLLVASSCHAFLITQVPDLDRRTGIPAVNWVTAIVLYSMTRLVTVLQELRRTREHLARLQVDEERLRISRDLHDIIGRTLVAVSLRTETAIRLVDIDINRCREQLEQLQTSISTGQAQLRSLTSGPVITGLTSEVDTATRLFHRLGIRLSVETVPVEDPDVDKTLAAVVRESVTNTLKHSRPHECRISVRRESLATVLTVVNDGASAAQPGADPFDSGTGLRDMRARVESLGGTLTAGGVDGQFRTIARIPHGSVDHPVDPPVAEPRSEPAHTGGEAR